MNREREWARGPLPADLRILVGLAELESITKRKPSPEGLGGFSKSAEPVRDRAGLMLWLGVQSMNSGARLLGFESWLCHLAAG